MATELYELSVEGIHNGQFVENVMHFVGDNLTANDTWESGYDLLHSWETNIVSLWQACLPQSYQVTRTTARRILVKPSVVAHTQYQMGDLPGTGATDAASYQLCPSVFLVPPLGVKSGGRVFMPAISVVDINGNVYASGYVANINALFTAMTANFGTGSITWQMAILSRKLGTYALVKAWGLSPVIGFQSRRRKAVGG